MASSNFARMDAITLDTDLIIGGIPFPNPSELQKGWKTLANIWYYCIPRSFYASQLEAILSAQGITHLVLTGIATDGVVEGTARDGVDRGYYVVIPGDCCMTFSEDRHREALRGVLGMLTTVSTAEEVIAVLPN